MRTLFWLVVSNPFLVKALRARQRGGSVYWRCGLAGLASLGGLILTLELARRTAYPDEIPAYLQTYDAIVFSILFVVGTLGACGTTNGSLCQEILSGTLEFQRLTSLTLRQIVAGKVIGELVTIYLMFFSVLPVLVLSAALGGYPLQIKAFGLLLCFTTAILFGAAGTVVPIRTVLRTNRPWNVLLGLIIGGGWMAFPAVIAQGCDGMVGLLVGAFTPLPFVLSLFEGEFFVRSVELYGTTVPIELVSPFLHLVVAVLLILVASRNLRMDERPPLPRAAGYLLAIATGFLVAGMATGTGLRIFIPIASSVYFFGGTAALTAVMLTAFHLSTPRKDGYLRWLWREKEAAGPLAYVFGDFSPAWITAAIHVGLYVLILLALVWVVKGGFSPSIPPRWIPGPDFLLIMIVGFATSTLLIHACNLAVGGYGVIILAVLELALLLAASAIIFALTAGNPPSLPAWGWLPALSWPLLFLWYIASTGATPAVLPVQAQIVFVGSHTAFTLIALIFAFGICRYHARVIKRKKAEMGIGQEKDDGEPMPPLEPRDVAAAGPVSMNTPPAEQ